jgi:8-oxo-dGTP diphosphatase
MDGSDAKLLMVMGNPQRDPRKHIVSIVYEIQVDEHQQPLAGDDAADARFWPIQTLLSGEVEFAGDHLTILKNWLNQ